MKKYITLLFIFSMSSFAFGIEPPRASEIHSQLNSFWKNGEFDSIDGYMITLKNNWPNYLPARVANATYLYRQGSQVEDMLDIFKEIEKELKSNILLSPPVFMDVLISHIQRYSKALIRYQNSGLSKEERKIKFSPRNTPSEKRSKSWRFQLLIETSPEVSVENGTIVKHHQIDTDETSENEDMLVSTVNNTKEPKTKRYKAIMKLGKIKCKKFLPKLLDSLDSGDWKLSQVSAESICHMNEDAIPELVKIVKEEDLSSSKRKMAIWSLILIGSNNYEVISSLEAVVQNSSVNNVVVYAQNALNHLHK